MKKGLIIKIISKFCYVEVDDQIYETESRGVFRYQEISPIVGDNVIIDKIDEKNKKAIIIEIAKRKNELIRPRVANIDQMAIITALIKPRLSSYLLNKYLALIEYYNIEPLLIFTKKDLVTEKEQKVLDLVTAYKNLEYKVVIISNKNPDEQFKVLKTFLDNKLTVFAGQSGAGKSSTLNQLDLKLNIKTQEISSKMERGKHTTTYNEILDLGYGKVIDSPGFSTFDINSLQPYELARSFHFLKLWAKECKFRRCLHYYEIDCRVKIALDNQELDLQIYQDYVKMINELKRGYKNEKNKNFS